jgi:hypothetical protein
MRTIMNNLTITNESDIEEIVVDSDMILVIELEEVERNLTISVMPNCCLRVFDCGDRTHNNIVYNIDNNCNVVVNKLSKDSCDKVTININDRDSVINFHNSIINYTDNEYKVIVNHKVGNSISKIVNHAINVFDKNFKFIVDGIITKDAIDTKLKQDNKIINLNSGKSYILPNLIVDNSEIEAEHSAYVGYFDEDKLFYLESRGIDSSTAEKLLIKAFLLNDMDLEEKERDIFIAKIDNI